MVLKVPHAIQREHDELHSELAPRDEMRVLVRNLIFQCVSRKRHSAGFVQHEGVM